MRCCVDGENKSWCALLICLSSVSAQAVTHRSWYIEEINRALEPNSTATNVSVSSRILNLSDSVSGHLEAAAFLGHTQLALGSGYNAFGVLNSTQELTAKSDLQGETAFFSAELSRLYVDERNYYGRVSAKWVKFEPSKLMAMRPLIETGVLSSISQPWEVRLLISGFLYFNHLSDFIFVTISSGRSYFLDTEEHKIRLTGSFTVVQKLRLEKGENTLFSFGPEIQYSNPSLGKLSLSVPFRVWIDWVSVAPGQNGYSSDFDTPAFRVAWTKSW